MPLLTTLRLTCQYYGIYYVSSVHEKLEDGSSLYGVEIEIPPLLPKDKPTQLFFWADCNSIELFAYEQAASKALSYLHAFYNFPIIEYNSCNLSLYKEMSKILLPIANRGLQLARHIIMSSQYGVPEFQSIVALAHGLIHDTESITRLH